MENVIGLIGQHQPDEIKINGVVDGGTVFNDTLEYFEGTSVGEKVYNLYYTMELNPPQSMIMTLTNGEVLEIF